MIMEGRSVLQWIWTAVVAALLTFRPETIHQFLETGFSGGLSRPTSRECLYNRTLALYLVENASAVYIEDSSKLLSWTCSKCGGLTKSYVKLADDAEGVIVTFRGTQESSYQNWAEDLYFRQLDLNFPGIANAFVHKGFYQGYHNTALRDGVTSAVMSILAEKGDLTVFVVGHSMGGAMATFCALDLSPLVGTIFAAAYSALVPDTVRMTHAHDVVPHLPPYYALLAERTYHHFPTEVWIYKIQFGRLTYQFERVCDSSGEDPHCSRLGSRLETKVAPTRDSSTTFYGDLTIMDSTWHGKLGLFLPS